MKRSVMASTISGVKLHEVFLASDGRAKSEPRRNARTRLGSTPSCSAIAFGVTTFGASVSLVFGAILFTSFGRVRCLRFITTSLSYGVPKINVAWRLFTNPLQAGGLYRPHEPTIDLKRRPSLGLSGACDKLSGMRENRAARPLPARMKSSDAGPPAPPELSEDATPILAQPQNQNKELSILQKHCARLYGTGMKRAQIAKAMLDYLSPDKSRPVEVRMSKARAKLRRWEQRQLFRDAVYDHAVVELDMQVPGIMRGVINKARRGRVDAARLVLEVTGRHNPKGDTNPPAVVVHIDGVPRPEYQEVRPTADITYQEDEVQEA